jgi:mono/diheme cytochrome c family protein
MLLHITSHEKCRPLGVAFAIVVSTSFGESSSIALAESLIERGEYLANIMDCTGCHTAGALAGTPDPERYLAGSDIGFQIPGLGVFYPPNLTPDVETGLGKWSEAEIMQAVRSGLRPDGRELVPVMPWPSYAALTDEDAQALAAYLKSLPPMKFRAPGPFGEGETPTSPYLTVVVPE